VEGRNIRTCQFTSWYARDIDLIKHDFSRDMAGVKIGFSIELESFGSP
jgi:hypothetical protein